MMKTITTAITVLPAGEDILSEMATIISIDDMGGGPYVTVSQTGRTGRFAVSPEEWPAIRDAIEKMLETCEELSDANRKTEGTQ